MLTATFTILVFLATAAGTYAAPTFGVRFCLGVFGFCIILLVNGTFA